VNVATPARLSAVSRLQSVHALPVISKLQWTDVSFLCPAADAWELVFEKDGKQQ
jgi:hypothetical protein